MSNAATTGEPANDSRDGAATTLTLSQIDAILADFRGWLTDLASSGCASPEQPRHEPVDLFTLVSQFTALRHEVNMQTRAARAAVEQNAEVLKQISEPDNNSAALRPIAKGLIDIADALSLSLQHLEKFDDTAEPLLRDLNRGERRGLLGRIFSSGAMDASPSPALEKLRQLVAAAADGYALSLRRVERLLPDLELEPMACLGELFDPETMEVVEAVGDTEQPPGFVVEEVRTGYRWRGQVLRFAQVKVAR
jgi:molecular chaperone GrpE